MASDNSRICICYIRVSSSKQERWSPAAQTKALEAHARRQHWRFETHTETGSGETIAGRPVFAALLQRIAAGEAHTLLVIEAERITRPTDLRELALVHEACRAGDCRVATPQQTLDLRDAEDTFLSTLFGALAAREKAKLLARQRRGQAEARAAGRWPGGRPPLGYTYDRERRTLVPSADAPVVRELLERAAQVGIARLATEYPAWPPWRVQRTFTRKRLAFYAGLLPQPDGTTVPGDWEPLISPALAARINAARERRRSRPDYHPRARRLLVGLGVVRCGHCGRALGAVSRTRTLTTTGEHRRYYSYACRPPGVERTGCPGSRTRPCRVLDAVVRRAVWRAALHLLRAPVRAEPGEGRATPAARALAAAQARRERLVQAVEDGTLAAHEARERVEALRLEIAALARRVEAETPQQSGAVPVPEALLAGADPLSAPPEAMRALIVAVCREIAVYADGRVVLTLVTGERRECRCPA